MSIVGKLNESSMLLSANTNRIFESTNTLEMNNEQPLQALISAGFTKSNEEVYKLRAKH